MAYLFDGSGDYLTFTKPAAAVDLTAISYAFTYTKASYSGTYKEIFWAGGNWPTTFHTFVQHDNSNYMAFCADWSGGHGRWSIDNPTADTWVTDVWTYDFGSITNDPLAYRGGSSMTVTERVTPLGSSNAAKDTTALRIGAYADGSGEYWNGNIAEFAIWNRVLNAQEAILVSKGFSPLFVPNGLVYYIPMIRETQAVVGGGSGTVTNAVVTPHPRIFYPAPPQMRTNTTTAAPPAGTYVNSYYGPSGYF